ncbi:MAG: MFS transporter, partial [Candidatus Sulfotelmatobacter sp.]
MSVSSRISAWSKRVSEPAVQSAPPPGPSVISASSASPIVPEGHRWIIAIAVMSSAVMEVLDTSVVNVSLPHIAGSLSSSVEEATWVLTSYIVANAIILPISGWLANYLGRKRLLMTVVTGFTLSSVLCGLAPNLPALIFFRVL